MNLDDISDSIAGAAGILDPVGAPVADAVRAILPAGVAKDALQGTWLGHPLHPVLTDVVIGSWTSSFLLDLLGGRRARPASQRLIALGILSAVPTIAAGVADWSDLEVRDQRIGLVHAASNVAATGTYVLSYRARRRGHHARGVAWGLVGATVASFGGFLGGHLAFNRAAGVNHSIGSEGPIDWTDVDVASEPAREGPVAVEIGDATAVLARVDETLYALGDVCSHQGGPLHEGEVAGACIRCPWHGSEFRLADGTVARGPATISQPVYEIRGDDHSDADGGKHDGIALRMTHPTTPPTGSSY